MSHTDLSKKPLSGVISSWTLHRNTIEQDAFIKMMGKGYVEGMIPMILTGEVVEDFKGRWEPGQCMFSTVIFEVDFFCMRIGTRNSVYQLSGPGIVLDKMPKEIEFDVGNAIMALSVYQQGSGGIPVHITPISTEESHHE